MDIEAHGVTSNQKTDKTNKKERNHKPDILTYKIDSQLNLSTFLLIIGQWLEIFANMLKISFEVNEIV